MWLVQVWADSWVMKELRDAFERLPSDLCIADFKICPIYVGETKQHPINPAMTSDPENNLMGLLCVNCVNFVIICIYLCKHPAEWMNIFTNPHYCDLRHTNLLTKHVWCWQANAKHIYGIFLILFCEQFYLRYRNQALQDTLPISGFP